MANFLGHDLLSSLSLQQLFFKWLPFGLLSKSNSCDQNHGIFLVKLARDLTRVFGKSPAISGKSRLVKYYEPFGQHVCGHYCWGGGQPKVYPMVSYIKGGGARDHAEASI